MQDVVSKLPVKFEVLEDDGLPIPFKDTVPQHRTMLAVEGKIRVGHAYRNARECVFDPDTPHRLLHLSEAFLILANAFPLSSIRECVELAVEDIKNKTVGVPHAELINLEWLAKKRAEWAAQSRKKPRKKQNGRRTKKTS